MTYRILISCLLFWAGLYALPTLAEDSIEYRFERLWPQLEQPWYFNHPRGIAIAPDGSVYVADTNNHRIQHFSVDGAYLGQWGGEGTSNGQFNLPESIAVATDGSVYVADTFNHRIQHFSANGNYLGQWGSKGSSAGLLSQPRGLAIAPDGSIYVADTENARIQHFAADGSYLEQWGSAGTGHGEFDNPIAVAIALTGDVYVADAGNHRIQQFAADRNYLRQWNGQSSGNGIFGSPESLVIAQDGSLFVADAWDHRILHFSADGVYLKQWGSRGTGIRQFFFPRGLAITPDGKLYVADTANDRIQNFTLNGIFRTQWGSRGSGNGQFNSPQDIAMAQDGKLFISDTKNNRIQSFAADGTYLDQWGSRGFGDGKFSESRNLAIASDGSIYISDFNNHHIQHFKADGTFLGKWGSEGSGDGQFKSPQGLAIAPDDSIYVADTGNNRMQRFTADGTFLGKWGSQGSNDGQFFSPHGLAINQDGWVYVADTENHRIQRFQADGSFLGKWGVSGTDDGQFNRPNNLTIAADGNIYVSDTFNDRIQYFTAEGDFLGKWGSSGTGEGQFFSPTGLASDNDGIIYIADKGNNRIQKLVPRNKTNITVTVTFGTETPEITTTTHPYKAIILAGGGEHIAGRINPIWDGTWRLTQKAYHALSRQAFIIHDEIKFLTAGSTQFDLDLNNKFDDLEVASKDSLRLAITEWASDAKDVLIFVANHGGPGKFQVNGTEILSGEELNDWVTQLQEKIPGKITVVIEACNSASFFEHLSKTDRYLLASAKADQAAVISNDGLTAFSYFLWSEIATGALLKDAFVDARQAMSSVIINHEARDAQADTNGDKIFNSADLDQLGNYCLGLCNKTAGTPPVINPLNNNSQTLHGETALDLSITVNHLQPLNTAWVLVQRPDDISIDPNQVLNFEKVPLSCDGQGVCSGRYERFDLQGQYQLSFYAMDMLFEVSFPETLTVHQTQGKTVHPVQYDDLQAIVNLRDVEYQGIHYQAALTFQNGLFVLTAASLAPDVFTPAAQFDSNTGLLLIPHAKAFGQDYQATFTHLGNFMFQLHSASPKITGKNRAFDIKLQ